MDRDTTRAVEPWTAVGEDETLQRTSIFTVWRTRRRSPTCGREHDFVRIEAPDWVNVIAVTGPGEVVLVEQYRHGTEEVTLEIPGGAVDPGETPAAAAGRELEEETGYRAEALELIGVVDPNPAFLSNRCWTFLATSCRRDGTAAPDPSEELTVRTVGLAVFSDLVADGTIRHALVVAAHDHLRRGIERSAPWAEALRNGDGSPRG